MMASVRRSREKIIYIRKRRGVTAPSWFSARALLRRARLLERRDHVAGLVRFRVDHHLLAGRAELLDILVLDAAELRLHHARLRPLAVLAPADRADDGLGLV